MGKLDELIEKHRRMGERIKLEKARISKASRAADTRRKILVGAFVMDNEDQYKALLKSKAFDNYLTREKDRALFDLPSAPRQSAPKPEEGFAIKPDSEKL